MLQILTKPEKTKTGTAATVNELKNQLNIPVEFTDDDDILTDKLAAAVEFVEDDTHSDILETANVLTHRLNIEAKPETMPRTIHIYQAPVNTVSKLEYSTDGQNWTELAATKYGYEVKFNRVEITIFEPVAASHIRFTFATGYADNARPKRLKQAVLIKAADLFEAERSNYVLGAPVANNNVYLNCILPHTRVYW